MGEEISNIACNCCGERFKSVCGSIKKDDDAYSVYFATLHTGHSDIMVCLTVSIGKWWDDTALDERHWICVTVKPSEANFNMRIEEPDVSRHKDFKALGIALSRDEALSSELKEDFFAIADYIVVEDPAVNSYLLGFLDAKTRAPLVATFCHRKRKRRSSNENGTIRSLLPLPCRGTRRLSKSTSLH